MQASFHTEEVSLEHQFVMPVVPGPETIGRLDDRIQGEGGNIDEWFKRQHPIDQRFVGELPWSPNRSKDPHQKIWIRADGTLPEDPLLHACVITYASDMSLFDSILAPHSIRWDNGSFMGASLDHCMWFHRVRPRRPVAALRHRLPDRPRRPRSRARLPVNRSRPTDDFDGPRGPHPGRRSQQGEGEVMSTQR